MDTPNERRKLERFRIEIPAKIEVTRTDHEEMQHVLFTKDISSGGAYFRTEKPLSVGTEVRVDLVLPLDKLKKFLSDREKVTVNVTGKVLRSEPHGMAIGFSENYKFHPQRQQGESRHGDVLLSEERKPLSDAGRHGESS
jgi:c-di-GMP-binding flagellar brake protein YcgR